mgnify:CR=1 FL=1
MNRIPERTRSVEHRELLVLIHQEDNVDDEGEDGRPDTEQHSKDSDPHGRVVESGVPGKQHGPVVQSRRGSNTKKKATINVMPIFEVLPVNRAATNFEHLTRTDHSVACPACERQVPPEASLDVCRTSERFSSAAS